MEAEPSSNHDGGGGGVLLPEDIIFEVLARLPVKPLCRFRCVSKAWRALISDRGFAAAQRSQAGPLIAAMFEFGIWPNQIKLEVRVLDKDGSVLRVFEVKETPSARLEHTRLDLICVNRGKMLGVMIVDPVAGRAFTVGDEEKIITRLWDYVFGRATPSGAYKLLRLDQTCTLFPHVVSEVATIMDDGGAEPTWRQSRPSSPPFVPCLASKYRAAVNGVLYFMPQSVGARTLGWNRIVAFDLESEAWMEAINGPPLGLKEEIEPLMVALTDLNGTLCMVIHNLQGYSQYAKIWRLVDYNKSVWVKAYTILLPEKCLFIRALDVLDDGRMLLANISWNRNTLQLYNPRTKAFRDVMEMEGGSNNDGRMTLYTGNLLSS